MSEPGDRHKSIHCRYAQCPFFRGVNAKDAIECEGPVDRSYLDLVFRRRDDYSRYMDCYCSKHYQKCPIYTMLMNTYKEE